MISTILKGIFCMSGLAVTLVSLLQEGKAQNGLTGVVSSTDSYWSKNKKNTLEGKIESLIKILAATFVGSAFILMFL